MYDTPKKSHFFEIAMSQVTEAFNTKYTWKKLFIAWFALGDRELYELKKRSVCNIFSLVKKVHRLINPENVRNLGLKIAYL